MLIPPPPLFFATAYNYMVVVKGLNTIFLLGFN